jgi:uncharacterized protein (TIGR02996 family)
MESAFLQAICEAPEDDGPRLMYADWLEERAAPGDAERAEYIRISCERWDRLDNRWADALAGMSDCARRQWLATRSKELLRGCAPNARGVRIARSALWAGDLLNSLFGAQWWYYRGFVAVIRLSSAAFFKHAGVLFAQHPIQEVELSDQQPLAEYLHTSHEWYFGRRATVPHSLSARLKKHWPRPVIGRTINYPTQLVAVRDLSLACVSFGRATMRKRS